MVTAGSGYGTPTRLAQRAALRVKPSSSAIERAYVRGLMEGMRRGEARRAELLAAKNELGIRYRTALGEITRLKLGLEEFDV
jgi:hypothetical protein